VRTTVPLDQIGQLVEGRHENPFHLLGPHEVNEAGRRALAVRAFLPHSTQAWVIDPAHDQSPRPMRRIHPAGLYEAICPLVEGNGTARYLLRIAAEDGKKHSMYDPYSFPHLLTDYDLHLLNEGRHWRLYEKLGAQLRTIDGVEGVNFAVWAPNATSVSLIGDFNAWDSRRHPMRKHIPSGFWELFVPGLGEGTLYKYLVRHHDHVFEKADPVGFSAECPPRTASRVVDVSRYHWHDDAWMARRRATNWLEEPLTFYEVHLGSWRRPGDDPHRWLSYRELAHLLVDYVKEMGYTHIELLPVSEHPLSASWGYQTVGYYAATARYGTPHDFMYFVDLCHQNDIGVIVDWVPAHFPRDGHGLRRFDGTALYEHADPRQGEHRDWGTMVFNYGRHEVRNFLVANALFWLDKYHVDGLRVDAVASMLYLDYSRRDGDWLPNEFGGRENLRAIALLKELNEQCHLQFPGVLTIAEESTAWGGVSRPTYVGGLGFSLKWNMGWMNDTLRYLSELPINRRYHHGELTFSLIYAFSEQFILPLSHDEVVHGKGSLMRKMPGDWWQQLAGVRALLAYQWSHPGKQLLFMGQEFAQEAEWNESRGLDWWHLDNPTHAGVADLVSTMNAIYRKSRALWADDFSHEGFEWIEAGDADHNVLVYMRKTPDFSEHMVCIVNFAGIPHEGYRVGLPHGGDWLEVLNTDAVEYGGSGVGNLGRVESEEIPWQGRPWSVRLRVPPLGALWLVPDTTGNTD